MIHNIQVLPDGGTVVLPLLGATVVLPRLGGTVVLPPLVLQFIFISGASTIYTFNNNDKSVQLKNCHLQLQNSQHYIEIVIYITCLQLTFR